MKGSKFNDFIIRIYVPDAIKLPADFEMTANLAVGCRDCATPKQLCRRHTPTRERSWAEFWVVAKLLRFRCSNPGPVPYLQPPVGRHLC